MTIIRNIGALSAGAASAARRGRVRHAAWPRPVKLAVAAAIWAVIITGTLAGGWGRIAAVAVSATVILAL